MDSRKKRIEDIKEDLRTWNRDGIVLDSIYESLKKRDVHGFISLYKKYKKLIPEMKRYEELIKNYDDPRSLRYMKILKNPLEYETHMDEIESFVKEKRNLEASEDEIFGLLSGVKDNEMMSGLNPAYTFDNYEIHEGNELAVTAARKIIESPGSINPLIIIGESGTGKTHLLNAIGNEYIHRGKRVFYKNAEELVLNKNMSFDVEIILLDDFHILLEREDMHPLVNLILESFSQGEKQVVIASNFNVSYYTIEQSLMSKIESGIRIELSNPDETTRVRILKDKTKEMNIDIEDDILLYLSKNIQNLSRLISTLKKLLAFSKILGEKPTIAIAADIIKNRISLNEGMSYIVEEEKPYRSISYLKEVINRGYKGVVITRINPDRFEKVYGLKSDVYWLTEHETSKLSIPPILENVNYFMEKFKTGKYALFLDGIDFLMSKNSPESVIQFIRHTIDVISETKVILIVTLNPKTIEEKYLKILERELEII